MLGYVVMPEHFHFMITEPDRADPSVVMKALKQTVARRLLADGADHLWQKPFYDFNVYSEEKFGGKTEIHAPESGAPNKRRCCGCCGGNPIKRGLVENPEDWKWSSYRTYGVKERGTVNMDWYFPPYTLGEPRVRMLG